MSSTIFVSHRIDEVFELADRISVLRDGHSVGEAATGELTRGALIHMMVGRELEEETRAEEGRRHDDAEAVLLSARGLSAPGLFADVDLDVGAGEIVGLAGLVGAGRSELLETLFGLRAASGGTVEIDGVQRALRFAARRYPQPGGLRPRGSQDTGPRAGDEASARTSSWPRRRRVPRLSYPRPAREAAVVQSAFSSLQIRANSPGVSVSTLSGGNQQKVVLGKWLASEPRVLMLDEPTRGVDVGAKAEIYRLLLGAAKDGIGILVSSSETPELPSALRPHRRHVPRTDRRVALARRSDEARIAHFAGGHE